MLKITVLLDATVVPGKVRYLSRERVWGDQKRFLSIVSNSVQLERALRKYSVNKFAK